MDSGGTSGHGSEDKRVLTVYCALHPKADVDRLHLKRSEGGRGMINIQDYVTLESDSLQAYVERSDETAPRAVHRQQVLRSRDGKKTR